MRGKSQPLTFHGQISGSKNSATVSTEVEIDRSLWGITWGTEMGARLKNRVTVSAHFDRA